MQWTLSDIDMLNLAKYADGMWETCHQKRIDRGQPNETQNRKQDIKGKACEFIAWYQARLEGRQIKLPDLTIYKPSEKSYSPDLISLDGLPNIHIKGFRI